MRSQGKNFAIDVSLMGLLLALAVMMGYIEMLIPVNIGLPGIKPGLANVVILYVLYQRGIGRALLISVLRTVIIAVLFTSPAMLVYSFSGAAVSIIVMNMLKRSGSFSIFGVSAAGGVAHNITQLSAAVFVGGGINAWKYLLCFYLPVLMIAGEVTGLVNAKLAGIIIKRIKDPNKESGCTHT